MKRWVALALSACASPPPPAVDAPMAQPVMSSFVVDVGPRPSAEPVASTDPPPPDPPQEPDDPSAPATATPAPAASAGPATIAAIMQSCPPQQPGRPPPALVSAGARRFLVAGPSARSPRSLPLLVTEIQQLEELKKTSSPTSKNRPLLLYRLARDYYELEAAAYRECTTATTTAVVQQRAKTMAAAQREAKKQCAALAKDHPQYTPPEPCPTN